MGEFISLSLVTIIMVPVCLIGIIWMLSSILMCGSMLIQLLRILAIVSWWIVKIIAYSILAVFYLSILPITLTTQLIVKLINKNKVSVQTSDKSDPQSHTSHTD